jgi:hypothetical protein
MKKHIDSGNNYSENQKHPAILFVFYGGLQDEAKNN